MELEIYFPPRYHNLKNELIDTRSKKKTNMCHLKLIRIRFQP